jgi:uncharacterized membrane protein YfcA
MAYSSLMMFRQRRELASEGIRPAPLSDYLGLHNSYYDPAVGREVHYRVGNTPVGLGMSYFAGVISGLLGIGGGALKVTAMDLAMRLPIKVSSATSNFMIGVTAAASAGVYFMRGDIDPFIAAPVATGVLIGATFGSRLLGRMQSSTVRVAFIAILLFISAQMIFKGLVH